MLLKILFLIGLVLFLPGCSKEGELEEETDIDEADQEEIKDAIQENESEEDEPCLCGACVTCSKATEDSANVHIVKNDGTVVVGDIQELNRTDILLSQCFNGCTAETAENGLCSVTKEDIEGGAWQNTDEERSVDGEETLKQNESYMICTRGFGLIYFVDSGQELRTAWDTLNRYINPETLNYMNSRWEEKKFKAKYGEDIFEKMITLMFQAGITEDISICAFLATIGTESGYGLYTSENREDYSGKEYTKDTRGVGLIQVTGMNQKEFIKWLLENGDLQDENRKDLEECSKGYEKQGDVAINKWTYDKIVDGQKISIGAADYLADNYAVEISIWYWGYSNWVYYNDLSDTDKPSNCTPNDYIVKFAEENNNYDNVFLASQMQVNTMGNWKFSRRHKIAMEKDPNVYSVWPFVSVEEAKNIEYESDDGAYGIEFFDEEGEEHNGRISLGWGQRYHDWLRLKDLWLEMEKE